MPLNKKNITEPFEKNTDQLKTNSDKRLALLALLALIDLTLLSGDSSSDDLPLTDREVLVLLSGDLSS